jgi:hypothetical protein
MMVGDLDRFKRTHADLYRVIARENRLTALTAWGCAGVLFLVTSGCAWLGWFGPASVGVSAALFLTLWGVQFWRKYRLVRRVLKEGIDP